MSGGVASRFPGRNGRAVVGVVLLAMIALLVLFGSLLHQRMNWAQETLASIEPRYARLLGLREFGAPVEGAVGELSANLARYAHPPGTDAQRIGTDLQQRIRALAEASGATVVGSQILPARVHGGFAQIPLKVTVNGTLESVRAFLFALESEAPSILVDNLQLNSAPRRARRGQPAVADRLVGQIDLSVLHLQP